MTAAVAHRRCHEAREGTCCKQVDRVFVRRVRRSAATSLVLLVARIGADLRYVEDLL